MRHHLSARWLSLAMLTSLFSFAPALAQDGVQKCDVIEWSRDLDEALAQSVQDGKPVIAYFTFNACHWCRKLEEDTYSDQSVIDMMMSRFHPVKINRDDTPEIPPQFNMSAYPSLITLGKDREKVHRFSSYMLPEEFKANLTEALRRYDLYLAGDEWDTPDPRPENISDDPSVSITTIKAPAAKVPAGITFLDGSMWVAQIGTLYELDDTGRVVKSLPIDNSVLDLCTDGKVIYAMTSGWTAGKPIFVIDPDSGATLRSIVTESRKEYGSYGAKGIEFVDGRLCILEGMNGIIHTIDPQSGVIQKSIQTQERWLTGLAFDGTNFITGGRDQLLFIDQDGARVKSIPVNYRLRSVGFRNDTLYVMEQPVFGYGKQHERIQIWPTQTNIYRLELKSDETAASSALGSRANPVRCDMPNGERAYLSRLRCADGSRPKFSRRGSYGTGSDGHVLDGYNVTCAGSEDVMIFMDMYHEEYVENRPVPGFTIVGR